MRQRIAKKSKSDNTVNLCLRILGGHELFFDDYYEEEIDDTFQTFPDGSKLLCERPTVH